MSGESKIYFYATHVHPHILVVECTWRCQEILHESIEVPIWQQNQNVGWNQLWIPDAHGSKTSRQWYVGEMWCLLVSDDSRDGGFSSLLGYQHVWRNIIFFRKSKVLDSGVNHGEFYLWMSEEGTGGVWDSLWIWWSSCYVRTIIVGKSIISQNYGWVSGFTFLSASWGGTSHNPLGFWEPGTKV